jgi:hypothetical protein
MVCGLPAHGGNRATNGVRARVSRIVAAVAHARPLRERPHRGGRAGTIVGQVAARIARKTVQPPASHPP